MRNPLSENTYSAPAPIIPGRNTIVRGNCCGTDTGNSSSTNIVGTRVVRGIIPFSNQTTVALNNYNTTYKAIYGNELITLEVFLGNSDYTQDEQTPPTITYATSGDQSSDIVSIAWNDYPVPVTGYILIAGILPITGVPGIVPNNILSFTFTQVSLIYDSSNLQWYLPLTLPAGTNPIYTKVNGVSISATYDNQNYTPGRLYSFADNAITQTIVITVL